MESYLRPHLYPDLLDSFKKIIPAEALCNFALSSRNACQTVARYITTPLTDRVKEEVVDDEFYDKKYSASILHQTTNGTLFEFTEQHHINQFLYLSGKFCECMNYTPSPKAPWNASFYEGVAENQSLYVIGDEDGRSFIEAYLSKRDTIDRISMCHCYDNVADLLVGKTIKKMYTNYGHRVDVNTALELNIEYLNIDYTEHPIEHYTFRIKEVECRASLKTLKKVKVAMCIGLHVVVPTLEKLRDIDKLVFSMVDMKHGRLASPDKVLNLVTQGMKMLWDAMLKFPGSVKIKFRPYLIGECGAKEVANVFRHHRGFKVKEKGCYDVKLRMKWTSFGETTKVLKVHVGYTLSLRMRK